MQQKDIVDRVTSKGVQFIIECIKGGYADYNNPNYYGPDARREHTASVAAACINCHIIERAKRMSVSIEMKDFVRISQKRGRTTFMLADHTEVWYKKLNKDGKPSFRTSQQALEYVKPPDSQPMLDMDMPPEKMRVVAGYRPYGASTEFEYEVLVTGPQENGKWWEIRLLGVEIYELFPAPAPAPVPVSTTEVLKKRVHVRKAKKSKANDDESDAQSV